MVPFWVLSIIRHLVFRGPKRGAIILTTTHIHDIATASYASNRPGDDIGVFWAHILFIARLDALSLDPLRLTAEAAPS